MALDTSSLCRMCAKQFVEGVSAFMTLENQRTVLALLEEHLDILVREDDVLPTHVCLGCLEKLQTWDQLRKEVITAQAILREIFGNVEESYVCTKNTNVAKEIGTKEVESVPELLVLQRKITQNKNTKTKTMDNCQKNATKIHKCSEVLCSKIFNSVSDLKRHIRIHTGDKPYTCNLCSLKFSQNGSLNRHMLTHTGEKHFVCECCSKRFSKRVLLNKHLLIHKNIKPYECPHCAKKFRDRSNLRAHMTLHSSEKPFMCTQCSKCFRLKRSLNRHFKSHEGQKPFQCTECSNRFVSKTNLKVHLLIHRGIKKFKCDLCDNVFRYKCNLRKHARCHSKVRTASSDLTENQPIIDCCVTMDHLDVL